MNANDLIRLFDDLPTNTYPPYGQPVTTNGDAWAGALVVRLADVLAVVGRAARRLEEDGRQLRPDGGFVLPALLMSPVVIVGLVGMLGLGTFWLVDRFEDRGFRNDISKLEQRLKDEQQVNATLRLQVSTYENSILRLEGTIKDMNARLDQIAARARQAELAANARVAQARREGAEAAAALRAPTTRVKAGHEEMNKWLTEWVGL